MDLLTDWFTERLVYWLTDLQTLIYWVITDWLSEWLIYYSIWLIYNALSDWFTDWLINWLVGLLIIFLAFWSLLLQLVKHVSYIVDVLTNSLVHCLTDWCIDKLIGSLFDWLVYWQTHWFPVWLTDVLTNMNVSLMYWQIHWFTVRLNDVLTNFLVHCLTEWCFDNNNNTGLEKNYNLNLPFGQASLKFHLPGQDFINCYFSLVHEQLVHILANRASKWGKSLVRHKNLLVPDDPPGLFSSPATSFIYTLKLKLHVLQLMGPC